MNLNAVPFGLDLQPQLPFLAHLCPHLLGSLSRYVATHVLRACSCSALLDQAHSHRVLLGTREAWTSVSWHSLAPPIPL